jgi:heptosyltransferase-2
MPADAATSALVIQTAFLGDVVLTTPLLDALARRHGPVDVVTTPAAAPLLDTHPAVRRVLVYDKRRADRGLPGLLRLVGTLRAGGYAIAYLPHRSLRSAALARLAGIPRRVGFHDGWPSLYTGVRRRPASGHEIDRLLALADERPHHQTAPSLGVTAGDHAAAERLLREAQVAAPVVAIAPGSIWGTKRWPGYAALAERLAGRAAVVAVGGAEDAALGGAIVAAVRAAGGVAVDACGRLGVREAAALIGRAAVLITNDSAPLHFAVAMGTPVVAIFGPTVPAFGFGPRGPRDVVVERVGLACRPCSAHGPRICPLGHHRCMRDILVEDVMRAIEETGALRRRD